MDSFESFRSAIYNVNERTFADIALELFAFQATENPVYRDYLAGLGVQQAAVSHISQIPYMPVSFFKNHTIATGNWHPEAIFRSSGTTGSATSTHLVADVNHYLENSLRCFAHFFGSIDQYHFMALLPSYLERNDSSLVAMIDHFIRKSGSAFSGFYLHNVDDLLGDIGKASQGERSVILWGVTFALLDLAADKRDLSKCLVFETGGMKGRRRELTRAAVHEKIRAAFGNPVVYSEYGMTELMSQAYTRGADRFFCPPWMRIEGRDITDPFRTGLLGETCGINVIDLANWHSIAFIETEDIGKVYADGSFEVLGRMDNSELRGCNLMVE